MFWDSLTAYDKATLKIYVNGVDQTSTHVDMPNIPDNSTDILTLASVRGASQFVNEDMDDVRVYSRALTTTQVEKLYAEGRESHNILAGIDSAINVLE